ncbi:hypothetical protein P8452_36275 [Trifolium repens]|nr:hypothetical protein QL285_067668 [Trifolium repens]WJX49897.1 hypothetical protein P8452_36275 [Trifolium repens]
MENSRKEQDVSFKIIREACNSGTQNNYFALNGQENKLDRMWDRMLQHFHESTPPAHMHGMLEHCVQHLPLHNTIQLPLNTYISDHTAILATHFNQAILLATLQSHNNQRICR